MIIKNVFCSFIQLKKYFTFEVQVLDDKNVRRRFRASNYQSTTRVKPFICTMPMRLDEGIDKSIQDGIKFNLIYQTLQEELMALIILKPLESPYMLIVASEEFISRIDSTASKSYHLSSNCFYQFKNNSELSSQVY